MTSAVIKKYDELVRCTNVLTEGIELEFHKFVAHQEKCRKKWSTAEEENHEMKKYMAKYKADQDTLEVKLKMARHQLDTEMKKRLKAEQNVDHMARQLQLIKELLLDKETGMTLSLEDKHALAMSINQQTTHYTPDQNPSHQCTNDSYTFQDSDTSAELARSMYDRSDEDILEMSGDILGDKRPGNKRRSVTYANNVNSSHPSAPPMTPLTPHHESTEEASEASEKPECTKRARISVDEVGYNRSTRYSSSQQQQVRKSVETKTKTTGTRFSTSPSKYKPSLNRLEHEFERPPRPEKRPPSKNHVREFVGSSTTLSESYDTDEAYDRENPVQQQSEENEVSEETQESQEGSQESQESDGSGGSQETQESEKRGNMPQRTFSLTRQHKYGKVQQQTQEVHKNLKQHNTVSSLYPSLDGLGTPPKDKFNTLSHTPASQRRTLNHQFITKLAVRMETCAPCNKKLRFGSNVAKCKECKAVCHPECKDKVPVPCFPMKDTPKKEGAIESYCDSRKSLQVPEIVSRCIEEIENRGLKEQGLYRIPGNDKEVKELKERFLRKKNPDLTKIVDTHVLCGCLKDFLRGLSEPLLTYALHESFIHAAATTDADDSLSAMYQCVSELPKANRQTLAAIMIHLQKVACSEVTSMNISNLSKVLGPTLVGHRSFNPSHYEMLEDTKSQPVVIARLLEMPTDYWGQFLTYPSAHPSNVQPTAKTPPYNPNFQTPGRKDGTPVTPEVKEAPGSSLGPINANESSRHNVTRKTYGAFTPKISKVTKDGKHQRHFFNSPS